MAHSPWKVGVEVETLAPVGSSRGAIADALASALDGRVERRFQRQGEKLPVRSEKPFCGLLPAFHVLSHDGTELVRLVDDVTLVDDLDVDAPAKDGWYKVGSDDARLMELVINTCDAEQPSDVLLEPIARLYRTHILRDPVGRTKVCAPGGQLIAATFPLRGEQERRCELVTAPLTEEREERLSVYLGVLRDQGALVPKEGATHLHFDAKPLCSARALARLVDLWEEAAPELRLRFKTNPHCRRLGPLQTELVEAIRAPGFQDLRWSQVRQRLLPLKPSKYRDLNLRNLLAGFPHKHTVEVRIFPVWLDEEPLFEAISVVEDLLRRAAQG